MILSGRRVLVVEDEYLVALGLDDNLRSLGYTVVGPVASLAAAVTAASSEQIDAAILDVNLAGEPVYPAAAILAERGIPFIFCSGYTGSVRMPAEFADAPRVAKPYTSRVIADALADLIGAGAGSGGGSGGGDHGRRNVSASNDI
ncbi:CheY-like chemotaxis protein [Xanthobacter sp. SG618]|uniref:response regulator n=1 Tax=Xanthobacter sp. SG618 TaxID=2587121 RepID=UPI0017D88BA4|nr:response regulator [Xanthobacter sp. SG618]NMN57532.1 CheY-like chemotaxis protein [Xanthobacter sp. SG618]